MDAILESKDDNGQLINVTLDEALCIEANEWWEARHASTTTQSSKAVLQLCFDFLPCDVASWTCLWNHIFRPKVFCHKLYGDVSPWNSDYKPSSSVRRYEKIVKHAIFFKWPVAVLCVEVLGKAFAFLNPFLFSYLFGIISWIDLKDLSV